MLWKDGYKSARLFCFENESKCCVTVSGQSAVSRIEIQVVSSSAKLENTVLLE